MLEKDPWPHVNIKTVFLGIGIPIIKMRRSWGRRFVCVMGLPGKTASDAYPDSKVHMANMGPTRVLSSPGGPHVSPMNLAIWVGMRINAEQYRHQTIQWKAWRFVWLR